MPIREPLKVSISPKAMSTLWWISASGGQRKPAMSNAQPKLHITTAVMSCACLFIRVPHLGEDVVPEAVVLVFHGCVCRFVGRRLRRTEHTRASSNAYLPELGTAVELCC